MQLSSPVSLIKKSVQIFFEKKSLVYFLKIYSPLVPFAIISLIQTYFVKTNYPLISWESGLSLFVGLASLIVYFLVSLAGIYAVKGVITGNVLSVRGTFEAAWANIWGFSLLSILLSLIYVGGFLLLIVPGIMFTVWFAFSRFIYVEKNAVKVSLSESRNLVKGKFWKIFGRLIVFGVFFILIQILAGIIPYGLGSILTAFGGALLILPSYLLYRELASGS